MATTKKTTIDKLTPDNLNANAGTQRGQGALEHSLRTFGAGRSVLVDKDDRIIAGNKTVETAGSIGMMDAVVVETKGDQIVVVKRTDISLDSPEGRGLAIADNRAGELNLEWNQDVLAELGEDIDLTPYFFDDEIEFPEVDEPFEGLTDEDDVPGLPESPVSKRGDIWILGNHRVMCGDSTDAADVALLMDGEKAQLIHADPPYGMGKESEGVANDNLYREKLDAFQMQWWRAFRPHVEDNASAYIWGNAEDLWRLWYSGGLRNSERLTFRNEIVWDKYDRATCKPTVIKMMRSYVNYTERALFFMLGEQGFNNNADNYWEGWEPIRRELEDSVIAMGWDSADVKRITGVGMYGHWFTKSQWSFIPKQHYDALQRAAHDAAFKREYDAFKREYDDLKRDFYATRAFFDNTHDNMTDVWRYPRVEGEDRHGHATPKPVDMMRRIMKSSAESGGLVVEPFGGSGATIAGAEATGRRCFTMELIPDWVDVIVKRWQDYTGKQARHADGRLFDQVNRVNQTSTLSD